MKQISQQFLLTFLFTNFMFNLFPCAIEKLEETVRKLEEETQTLEQSYRQAQIRLKQLAEELEKREESRMLMPAPFFRAVRSQDIDVANKLINEVDINEPDPEHPAWKALAHALSNKDIAMFELLLQHGAYIPENLEVSDIWKFHKLMSRDDGYKSEILQNMTKEYGDFRAAAKIMVKKYRKYYSKYHEAYEQYKLDEASKAIPNIATISGIPNDLTCIIDEFHKVRPMSYQEFIDFHEAEAKAKSNSCIIQ